MLEAWHHRSGGVHSPHRNSIRSATMVIVQTQYRRALDPWPATAKTPLGGTAVTTTGHKWAIHRWRQSRPYASILITLRRASTPWLRHSAPSPLTDAGMSRPFGLDGTGSFPYPPAASPRRMLPALST
ncbi:hypothetical protein CBM2633_P60023 [Cupriavidus taiwanensis]|uniref:Uncharacterized protein n=5 Tax=Cupriavidus TaxID=106589 RepID=A0A375CPE5_9BURK|nr:hypothetical protein CBM2588_P70024 [Cupriavidus taiwanensis]SOZ40774.1 hypothetical protein CBM2605_P60024 [Cupriavidus neocaledonicus]SOY76888.1 hypothetical protein CBM2592_P80023 [Cupriavidus taiwanensis]SOY76936.1 hypothetical protein CBM2585_P70004 [Cupriavidus taiwanensis]SOY77272.1 hypothetical protein CBM2589_P60023 [Cupriavidus taiwanensis]